MNISIFGLGYVGCVSLGCLARNGHTVTGVDVNITKVNQINAGQPTIIEKDIDIIIREERAKGNISATQDYLEAVMQTDISIITVGTPSTAEGHLNLEYVFKVAKNIAQAIALKQDFHIIAVRSTVLPGTCQKIAQLIASESGKEEEVDFAVVCNPEFLREGTAVRDYYHPPITLIGARSANAANKIASLYEQLPAEIVITETGVAEIMKYVNNTYHALKIAFANEIGNICSKLHIDSHQVMEIFCKDKQLNISPYYFKPGFAYGGSCLPKDLKGLQTLAHDLYISAPVINNIDISNALQIQRAITTIINKGKQKLGFLGLSFKAGTDDLRNSPAVTVIETLLGKGYDIMIYDKNVRLSRLTGTNKEYIDSRIPHLSKLMVDEIRQLMLLSDVIIISNNEPEYLEALETEPKEKIIIDLIHLDGKIRNKKEYAGINW